MWVRPAALGALIGIDAGVLCLLRPHLSLIAHLRAPHEWLAAAGVDVATWQLAAAALWLTAAWLAAGLAAVLAATLPGGAGRLAAATAHAVLPRAVYRLAAGAAGMGVLLAPVVAGAATPAGTPPAVASTVRPNPMWPTDDPLPAPAWPTTPSTSTRAPSPTPTTPSTSTRAPSPTPTTPSASTRAPSPTPTTPSASTRAPSPTLPPATPVPDRATARSPATNVVVQRGDSLWSIAASHLPGHPSDRRVMTAWPRWYAANRPALGNDPDHIVAGQLLRAPTQEETS